MTRRSSTRATRRSSSARRVLLALAAIATIAPPVAAMTEKEMADQVGLPDVLCVADSGSGFNTYVTLPAGHQYILKIGVSGSSTFLLGRWLAYGSIAYVAEVHHDGTVIEIDGSRPTSIIAIEDVNATSWFAILKLNLTAVSEAYSNTGLYWITGVPLNQCALSRAPGIGSDADLVGFVGRASCSGFSNCGLYTTFVAYNASAADGIPTTPPHLDAPANLTATPDTNAVNLSWSPSAGASAYHVRVAGRLVANTTGTHIRVTGLTGGVEYLFNVTAYNATLESLPSLVRATPFSPCDAPLETESSGFTLVSVEGFFVFMLLFALLLTLAWGIFYLARRVAGRA